MLLQFLGQLAHTLARPPQRRLRVSPRHRLHQPFQILAQTRILAHRALASASFPADPPLPCSFAPACSSLIPCLMTCRESPVARDTAEIPPQPIAIASLAANSRRVRSFSSPATRSYRCLISSSLFMPHSLSL